MPTLYPYGRPGIGSVAPWHVQDNIHTTAVTGEAPLGWHTEHASLGALWTTLYVPAITLSVLMGPNDLPLGVQRIGKRHQDRACLIAARWICSHLTST